MKKRLIRVWFRNLTCDDSQTVRVYFVWPDMFFDVELFICPSSGTIVGVDRERERYVGPKFDEVRDRLRCPECGETLSAAREYPQTFRWPDGSLGHFLPPREYPPDSERVDLEIWDALA